MSARTHRSLWILAVIAVGAAPAYAQRYAPETTQDIPASVTDGVTVTEHLGAKVPRDAAFVDQDGKLVTLGELLTDKPVLLTFNYSDCPNLCDLQLNNLAQTIANMKSVAGKHFRIVTVVLAPGETPARAKKTRDRYVAKIKSLGGKIEPDGWVFLLSRDGKDDAAIHAVAGAVGFGYKYLASQHQYVHPASVMMLTAGGMVSRYLHGVDPTAELLDTSVAIAALSEQASAAGYLLLCLHWNPHGRAAMGAAVMRYGALGFVMILIAVIVVAIVRRRSRHLPGVSPS